tara:strand:- start:7721 stop:8386 length:666 start_codon:yes stop_codon:yes gene_type:complete
MTKNKLKKYLEDYKVYFSSREEDNERIYNTIIRLLKLNYFNILEREKKILDVGSGDKSFYKICLKNDLDAYEIDGSEGINFEKDKLPYQDNDFDFVLFNAVIEHLYSPDKILSEIYRILKKDGVLILITPNFKYAFRNFYNDPTHVHPYTPQSLKKILEMNKFNNNNIFPFLVNKHNFYWKVPFKFFLASIIPFRNDSLKNFPFLNFLKGKSTSMISLSKK